LLATPVDDEKRCELAEEPSSRKDTKRTTATTAIPKPIGPRPHSRLPACIEWLSPTTPHE
jgi:hypothetical protein